MLECYCPIVRVIIREIGAIKRMLRRNYYIYFREDYVKKQIRKRRGLCGHHGCCDLSILHKVYNLYFRKCLSRDDRRRCLRWNNLPRECRIYPFDEKDKILETRSYCNFYWEEESASTQNNVG